MASEASENEVECVICFSQYDNIFKLPKVLNCHHIFCLECLAKINVNSVREKEVTCPICREVTPLPRGKGLPALDNDSILLSQLPPEMQKAQSIRFSRNKGRLYIKQKPASKSLLKNVHVNTISQSLDVGRPPLPQIHLNSSRVSFTQGSWCFLVVATAVILLTLALVLAGVFVFVGSTSGNFSSSITNPTMETPSQNFTNLDLP
uniref:Ring finger protein 225 n=2 Tax=Latimeria chalumnae TaxID=7897 RepID=M3XIK9_LATCH|nr:PREDICTED: RING finger protein 225 [Latimeria chalumnae]|eukprot:XP_005998173.1 PREDICTED: RING finger protein 225 [Latimeria chalumnae]